MEGVIQEDAYLPPTGSGRGPTMAWGLGSPSTPAPFFPNLVAHIPCAGEGEKHTCWSLLETYHPTTRPAVRGHKEWLVHGRIGGGLLGASELEQSHAAGQILDHGDLPQRRAERGHPPLFPQGYAAYITGTRLFLQGRLGLGATHLTMTATG